MDLRWTVAVGDPGPLPHPAVKWVLWASGTLLALVPMAWDLSVPALFVLVPFGAVVGYLVGIVLVGGTTATRVAGERALVIGADLEVEAFEAVVRVDWSRVAMRATGDWVVLVAFEFASIAAVTLFAWGLRTSCFAIATPVGVADTIIALAGAMVVCRWGWLGCVAILRRQPDLEVAAGPRGYWLKSPGVAVATPWWHSAGVAPAPRGAWVTATRGLPMEIPIPPDQARQWWADAARVRAEQATPSPDEDPPTEG